MARKPFIIVFVSQKGGVGKTTIALNLAVALTYKNHKVLLVDTDTESASLSEQLGIRPDGMGYLDMLGSKSEIKDTLFAYEPIYLQLLPGKQSEVKITPKPEHIVSFYGKLAHADFDFVIVDSPPGMFSSDVARYLNDVAILTTPDSVSSSSSAKMNQYCQRLKLEHRLIINRMGYSKYDLEREEVERIYGDVAFQTVPEDKIIAESLRKRKPAYMIDKNSDFCVAISELANDYSLKVDSRRGAEDEVFERSTTPTVFERLAKWFLK